MQSNSFNNSFYRTLFFGAGFISVVFILLTSIELVGSGESIWIEAEDTNEITYPLQITKMEGASGGEGVVSTGSHQKNIGYASYEFETTKEGKYFFWGRCFWDQVCSNSFLVIMDNLKRFRFGETPLTNQWHWINGSAFDLSKGKHKLNLWNAEEGAKIDKILLTADPNKIPEGLGLVTKWYIDLEEGKIPNLLQSENIDNWRLAKDEKQSNTYLRSSYNENDKKDEKLMLLDLEAPLANFVYRLCFKAKDSLNTTFSTYFNYQNRKNFHCVRFFRNKAILYRVSGGFREVILQKDSLSLFTNNEYSDIAIKRDINSYIIKVNGKTLFKFEDNVMPSKRLGFSASQGGVSVDNISIVPSVDAIHTENFHATGFHSMLERPESSPKYFDRLRKGRINWQILKGSWNHTSFWGNKSDAKKDGFEALEGRCENNDTASIVFGDDFWENYTLKLAAKANSNGSIGVYFNFQDSDNYYLFVWEKILSDWKFKILKKVDSIETIISEVQAFSLASGSAYWYKIEIKMKDGRSIVYIDDEPVIKAYDTAFLNGKTGFFTTCLQGAEFDDIQILPATEIELKRQTVHKYSFLQNADISQSYSGWIPSSDSVLRSINVEQKPQIFIVKELFEEIFLTNKKIFNNGIKISTHTSEIPKDIDVVYNFSLRGNKGKSNYQILITNNHASILRDKNVLATVEFHETKRNSINISRVKNIWNLKIDNNKILEYKDKLRIDSIEISIGYSGIGKGEIYWDQIVIKDKIENLKELN